MATTPTVASLQADVERLTDELAGQAALAQTATEQRDAVVIQRDTALANLKQAEFQRNFAAIGAAALFFIGGMIGYWIAPKGGDAKALEGQVQTLVGRATKAEEDLRACKAGSATLPAPASAPTSAAAPAATPVTQTVDVNVNVNGQPVHAAASRQTSPAAAPAAAKPAGPAASGTAVIPDGGCILTANADGAELKSKPGVKLPVGSEIARISNKEMNDTADAAIVALKKAHSAWLSDKGAHAGICLAWRRLAADRLVVEPGKLN